MKQGRNILKEKKKGELDAVESLKKKIKKLKKESFKMLRTKLPNV